MHLKSRNVNSVFKTLVDGIHSGGIFTLETPSRNGEAHYVPEPVIVTYSHPRERVLFNTARDANPFMHLYESLWMLAGRDDVAPLAYYCKRMRAYSDDGEILNGAYGYRWRYNTGEHELVDYEPIPHGTWEGRVDQLDKLVTHLKAHPFSRRAVLAMWNVEDDLLKINSSKDVPCNTHAYFAIEAGLCPRCDGKAVANGWPEPCTLCGNRPHDRPRYLNMTVCNRSNDLVWGLCGTNVVTFSFLQEYLAARLGLKVGVYHQVTNNLHVYANNWEPERWLAYYCRAGVVDYAPGAETVPLVADPERFERELPAFVERFAGRLPPEELAADWDEPFFRDVAQPMLIAFACHKARDYHGAFAGVAEIRAWDWQTAANAWLRRRCDRWEAKQTKPSVRVGTEKYHDGLEGVE